MTDVSAAAPLVVPTKAGLRASLSQYRARGARIALVPTMGALHAGHLALVDRARALTDVVVVSIFVNPLQFGANEDLDRYPRTLDADVAALASRGVELVFAPGVREMYPDGGSSTIVTAGPVAEAFEGAVRPGHFDGMLTVVSKLLHLVAPDVVVFGRKDAQQAFLVRRMVADLDLPVTVDVVPTVREDDGLALSSRNRYLGGDDRGTALLLSAALHAAEAASGDGVAAAVAAGRALFLARPEVRLDYFAIVDPSTFEPASDDFAGEALAIVAAVVGGTRLIDNLPVRFAG